MTAFFLGLLFLLLLLYGLLALFCCMETVFTSASYTWLKERAERGDRRATEACRLMDQGGVFLGTSLFGTNLTSITITTLFRSMLAMAILNADLLKILPSSLRVWSGWEDWLTTLIVTPTMLLFGEMMPKAIGRNYADKLALVLVRPLTMANRLFKPFVLSLDWASGRLARLVTGRELEVRRGQVTRDDLRLLAEVATEQGLVRKEAGDMLQMVLGLDTKPVETVMVPLVDVRSVPLTATVAELEALGAQTGFSRFPVYDGRVDEIVGIVSLRQCLYDQPLRMGENTARLDAQKITPYVNRNVLFVPESKSVSELLYELRYQHIPMAVVVDEHGGVVGLITVEDLVAEIVGGIHDARNQESVIIRVISPQIFECDGKADIRDIEEYLGFTIANQGFETAAGLVLKLAGRIPKVGDRFPYENWLIEVLAVQRRRVVKLRFTRKK
ncbi:MAG: HlyC/CorC family transporter [Lentisphaerae bacterium]|nr:HlyC/CorC family transporter [Lentisphaerota bacterium]